MFGSINKSALSALALVATVQLVPAPFLAAIPAAVGAGIGTTAGVVGAAAGVAGTVIAGVESGEERRSAAVRRTAFSRVKRQDYGTEQAWNDCKSQLGGEGVVITFSAPSPGTVLVAGIPSACMTLSTVITGQFNEGNPVPMGSDSIQFTGLTDEDIQAIQDALDARVAPPA